MLTTIKYLIGWFHKKIEQNTWKVLNKNSRTFQVIHSWVCLHPLLILFLMSMFMEARVYLIHRIVLKTPFKDKTNLKADTMNQICLINPKIIKRKTTKYTLKMETHCFLTPHLTIIFKFNQLSLRSKMKLQTTLWTRNTWFHFLRKARKHSFLKNVASLWRSHTKINNSI
jgi:hypothetical protein